MHICASPHLFRPKCKSTNSNFCSFCLRCQRMYLPCNYIAIISLKYYLHRSDHAKCYWLQAYPSCSGNINSSTTMGTLFVDCFFSILFSRDVSFQTSTELKQALSYRCSSHATSIVKFTLRCRPIASDKYAKSLEQLFVVLLIIFSFSCLFPMSWSPQWFLTSITSHILACSLNILIYVHEREADCSIPSIKAGCDIL